MQPRFFFQMQYERLWKLIMICMCQDLAMMLLPLNPYAQDKGFKLRIRKKSFFFVGLVID